MRARFTALALQDLNEIARWVAADRPNAAMRLVKGLRATATAVADHPYAHGFVEGREDKGVRRALYSRYLVCYRIEADCVLILRILDGSRDITSLV